MPENFYEWEDDNFSEDEWDLDKIKRFLREQGMGDGGDDNGGNDRYDEYKVFVLPDTTLIDCNRTFAESIDSNSDPSELRGRRLNQLLVNPVEAEEFEKRIGRLTLDNPTNIFFEDRVIMNEDQRSYRKSYRIICDHAILNSFAKIGCMFSIMVDVDTTEEIVTEADRLRKQSYLHRARVLTRRCQIENEMVKKQVEEKSTSVVVLAGQERKRREMTNIFNHAWVRIAASFALLVLVGFVAVGSTATWYEQYAIEKVKSEEAERYSEKLQRYNDNHAQEIERWKAAYESLRDETGQ